jgi:hypothetical protein
VSPERAPFDIGDYLAIQRLIHLYPRHLDSGDLTGLGMLFAKATVHFEGRAEPVDKDPAEITRMFAGFLKLYDGVPRTRHLMCNLIVTPIGPTLASGSSTVVVVQAAPGFPLQPIITGDYQDRFEKVDGTWHFAERLISNDLYGDLSAHGKYTIGAT